MRGLRTAALALVVLAASAAGVAATPEKTKTHGVSLSGTVERVDDAAKTLVVRNNAGKATTLVRTAATKVNGVGLKAGDRVAVRYLERDGKKVATSIRIEPPSVATATVTPTVPPPATR
ncbi:MAG TPA: hypothetical protein VMN82_15135 [Thermoanaerobaculia bacterium]|nr:hypothetical protein [Thermoanaerobaculia bacterium]